MFKSKIASLLVWLICLLLIISFLSIALPRAIIPSKGVVTSLPSLASATLAAADPTSTLEFDYSWIQKTQLEPISDQYWVDRPLPINNSGWDTIADAASMEPACLAKFIYPTWISEGGELDCEYWLTQPGPNPCISKSGARGPMQFMGAWNEAGISEPGWSIGNLHDSVRAACRMWTKMNLWSYVNDREGFALRFSSMDVYNAGRIPQYWTDRAWNAGPEGYKQALKIWDQAQSLP